MSEPSLIPYQLDPTREIVDDEPRFAAKLAKLKKRIEASSAFRFEWHFFRVVGLRGASEKAARRILESLAERQECHEFLRATFDPMYDDSFEIGPIHEHATLSEQPGEVERLLATAAQDRLGAYSKTRKDASRWQLRKVHRLLETLGDYRAFQLEAGRDPDCPTCRDCQNHLFTNWFFGVAWDWCFVVQWPERRLAWVAFMTDTD